MKSVLLLALVSLFSLNGIASSVILQYSVSPGYTPNPVSRTIEVLDNGIVQRVSHEHHTGLRTYTELGDLSDAVMEKIVGLTTQLTPSQLIDEQEGQPVCADAPVLTWSAMVDGQMMPIQRRANCHIYSLEGANAAAADHLITFLTGFAYIIGM